MATDIGYSHQVIDADRSTGRLFWLGLKTHLPVLLFGMVLTVLWIVLRDNAPIDYKPVGIGLALGVMMSFPVVTLVVCFLYLVGKMILTERPDSPLRRLWQMVRGVVGNPARLALGVPMILALMIFTHAFVIGKATFSAYVPFTWDQTFDQWDMALHFGYRPYEFLVPLLGNVVGTVLINLNYFLWFFLIYMFWFHFSFMANAGVERTRFFFAFMLVWSVGGMLGAAVFSSAGPCYFRELGLGADPYEPLRAVLTHVNETVPVSALGAQKELWVLYEKGSILGGVSAMPSMHNATAFLFVLATWNSHRWLRTILIVHMVLIFFGSVYLGWHYAVDAYIAWFTTGLCWISATWLARWWEDRPTQRAFAQVFQKA